MAKPQTTLRLSADARKMQEALAARLGLTLTAVVEMAIRELAERKGIAVSTKGTVGTEGRARVKAKK